MWKTKKWKAGDIVIVHLFDVTSSDEWLSNKEAEDYPLIEVAAIGCFINEDDQVIRISSFVADDGAKDIRVLPKAIIKSIKRVK